MKKFLKIFAIAAIAVAAAIACVFTGCNKGGDEDSYTKSDYNFTVVYSGGEKDGQKVNGQTDGVYGAVKVQICEPGQACYPVDAKIDAQGRISFSQAQIDEILDKTGVTVFVFHVLEVKDYDSDCEVTTTDGKGDYQVLVTLD